MSLLPWLFAPAVALVLLAAALVARPSPLPVGGDAERRGVARARLLWAALAAAAVLSLAVALVLARRDAAAGPVELVAGDRATVLVLDVSASVSDLVYREIARTLRAVVAGAGDDGRIGLVLFSDVAEEALPPGTRAAELERFLRFFLPSERGARARPSGGFVGGPGGGPSFRYPVSPWFLRFGGGTHISTGLAAARRALDRDGIGTARVLLVSDLAEAERDRAALEAELARFAADGRREVRIVALPPAGAEEASVFTSFLGDDASPVSSQSLGPVRGEGSGAGWPVALSAAILAAAAVLAAQQRFAVPLAWRSEQ